MSNLQFLVLFKLIFVNVLKSWVEPSAMPFRYCKDMKYHEHLFESLMT